MGGAASKAKGADFERAIARRLSLWVTDGAKEDVYWRSAMSGGRATMGKRRGVDLARQAGDITAVAPEGHTLTEKFYIELKAYRDLGIDRFFLGTGPLAGFWTICKREAAAHKRAPMLICKQNNYPILVLTGHDKLILANCKLHVWVHQPTTECIIVDLESMLKLKVEHVIN